MIRSFRLRLALQSAVLTGLTLAAFGVSSWWLIRNSKIERIDSEVRAKAEREAARPPENTRSWAETEARLAVTLGVRDSRNLLLYVQSSAGVTLYQSGHWPAQWDPRALPWPRPTGTGATLRPPETGLGSRLAGLLMSSAQAGEISMRPILLAQAGRGGGSVGGGAPRGGPSPGGPPGGAGAGTPPPGAAPPGQPGLPAGTAVPGPGPGPDPAGQGLPPPGQDSQPRPPQPDGPPLGAMPPPPAPAASIPVIPAAEEPAAPDRMVREHRPSAPTPNAGPREMRPEPHLVSPTGRSEERPRTDAGTAIAAPTSAPAPSTSPAIPANTPAPVHAPIYIPENEPPIMNPPALTSESRYLGDHVWRVALAASDHTRVVVAVDLQVIDTDMEGIRNALFIALPLALALIGAGGWWFSSRAMRPLREFSDATRRVNVMAVNQRISGEDKDREFLELVEVYNHMLDRLERSFKQAHRFSADAAHELKTPLAILQGQLEQAINNAEEGSALQADLSTILDEVRRLSTISRKLLLLSQADAGGLNVFQEPIDLSELLDDLVEDTHMLAPALQVSATIEPGLRITGDSSLLRQILHNLVSNAIKYNIDGGWIRITTAQAGAQIRVLVANASRGIPAGDRERIFERFYRADPSRHRGVEGVGLGLSVAREIARAHGGDLTLEFDPQGEVQFCLQLKAAPAAATGHTAA